VKYKTTTQLKSQVILQEAQLMLKPARRDLLYSVDITVSLHLLHGKHCFSQYEPANAFYSNRGCDTASG